MNNLENLKDYVDESMKNIIITDNIKKNIHDKIGNHKHNQFKWVAVVVMPIMILSLFVFNDQISSGTQRLLSYLPGINKIFYTDEENKVYGLLGSVEMSNKEKYIKVNSAYNEGNKVTLTMEGNVEIGKKIKGYITVVDVENNKADLISGDIIVDLDDDQWSARCIYEFPKMTNSFNIVYDKFSVPVIMTELPEIPIENYNYISSQNINADIAVISDYVESKLEISLLSQSYDNSKSISFPFEDIYLLDSKGNKFYSTDNNHENKLYFDKKLETGIKLVIPYIFITDNDAHANVTISKDGSLPIKFSLGDEELTINNVEWAKYNEKFNYKTPENSNYIIEEKAQKIKLTINNSLKSANGLKLQNISFNVNKNQLNEYKVENVNVIWDDPYRDTDSQNSGEESIGLILYNIKDMRKKVDVTFYDPIYSTHDEVIIPLRP